MVPLPLAAYQQTLLCLEDAMPSPSIHQSVLAEINQTLGLKSQNTYSSMPQ